MSGCISGALCGPLLEACRLHLSDLRSMCWLLEPHCSISGSGWVYWPSGRCPMVSVNFDPVGSCRGPGVLCCRSLPAGQAGCTLEQHKLLHSARTRAPNFLSDMSACCAYALIQQQNCRNMDQTLHMVNIRVWKVSKAHRSLYLHCCWLHGRSDSCLLKWATLQKCCTGLQIQLSCSFLLSPWATANIWNHLNIHDYTWKVITNL